MSTFLSVIIPTALGSWAIAVLMSASFTEPGDYLYRKVELELWHIFLGLPVLLFLVLIPLAAIRGVVKLIAKYRERSLSADVKLTRLLHAREETFLRQGGYYWVEKEMDRLFVKVRDVIERDPLAISVRFHINISGSSSTAMYRVRKRLLSEHLKMFGMSLKETSSKKDLIISLPPVLTPDEKEMAAEENKLKEFMIEETEENIHE